MNFHRRDFLKLSGAASAGLLFAQDAFATELFAGKTPLKSFGLQLYTLRDVLPNDPAGVLKQVAAAGYKTIESYTHDKLGMFWGMGNKGFKKFINDLGMSMPSAHTDVYKDFEQKVDDAAAIGVKYMIHAYEGRGKSIDEYRKMADDFNKMGEYCKKHGMKLAFHNHDMSFESINGEYGQKVLLDNTDASNVCFEMDMYWVVTAGQDPIEWLKKYPHRFKLCHVKDRTKNATEAADTCTLGKGSIDYAKILPVAKKCGMEQFIVEQEKYAGTTPIECMKDDAEYMRKLKI